MERAPDTGRDPRGAEPSRGPGSRQTSTAEQPTARFDSPARPGAAEQPTARSGTGDPATPTGAARGPRRWWQHLSSVLGWLAVAVALLGIALHYGISQRFSAVLLASFAPYLMLGAVLALLFFAVARRYRSGALALAVLAGAFWTQLPLFVADGHAGNGPPLTVLQSNLLFGGADADTVRAVVREERVDVLTAQELTLDAVARLDAAGLAEDLPYRYLEAGTGGGGSGIYSRYPIRDERRFDGFEMANLGVTVDHPELGPIQVLNFHPMPPPLDFGAWTAEMARTEQILAAGTGPVVVGADFNATRDHTAFRALLGGRFADAAELAGAGPQLTFPADRAWGPLIGIDHVLLAGGTAESVRTLTVPRSDHRAVLARIRLDD
ncbi:endonuclease/exonuclease/phosphatase family protein [Nocardia asteroides]|uniref:endonuclease/exonuclease/phosphatase family protein n=1 Tax=Nocardia asteroides TaxID=1824 RepID=UPI001E6168C4|nr:endonuclease/exonuclease/phosphatase family protein [Nocardia asteroides]UGT60624.1 endonuclease/exonuclease/phosphatase family protein [Nocardia asteroides]